MNPRTRRYKVRKRYDSWFLYTKAAWQMEWHYLNHYPTHQEALDTAVRYADYNLFIQRHFHPEEG